MSHHEVGDSLPLFRSPLRPAHDAEHGHGHSAAPVEKEDTPESSVKFGGETSEHPISEHPQFHQALQATNSELFYDLFFVANLTVFTAVHEVNDHTTLAQYIGFFSVLWFTWYQVGLYDVRFSQDSVWERIAKACQFGVMIGFAISGPKFDVGSAEVTDPQSDASGPSYSTFKALTLIIMASRFVLVLQYLQSLWFVKQYNRVRIPMLVIAGTYFVAGWIYLGLFWSFKPLPSGQTNHSYIAWYVVAAIETIIVTAVSSYWREISFKKTHLIERMALLTLIILGEGIMGLAKQCQAIVKSYIFNFSSSTTSNIVCAILIIYFLYMLYFDWIQEENFGTIRQQIWAFLHFPLHLALVLAVEGIGQSVAFRAATEKSNDLANSAITLVNNASVSWFDTGSQLNDTANTYINYGLAASKNIDQTSHLLGLFDLVNLTATAIKADESTDDERVNAVEALFYTIQSVVYQIAGFEPAKSGSGESSTPTTVDAALEESSKEIDGIGNVFSLVFVYFFVTIGLSVLLCTLLAAISKKEKSGAHWIRLIGSTIIGVGLCLIATMAASDSMALSNFALSPWVLPTVTLALFLVILLNSVRLPQSGGFLPQLVPMRSRT